MAAHPLDPPEIEPGEYAQDYLAELTARRFPPEMALDRLRYQDYQPPLYYYLAAVALRLAGADEAPRLAAVRLLGAFLGVLTVAVTYQAARWIVPGDPVLAVGSAAFVAFVPMRLAIASSASNDALAVLLATAMVYAAARRAAGGVDRTRYALVAGALAAAAILTKASAYPGLAVLAAGETVYWWRSGRTESGRTVGALAVTAALALAAAGPWFGRNASVYGGFDLLGTRAHNRIVEGQPRTAPWLAEHGAAAYLERFVSFTFQSFWGVFGWMGVFLDRRIYLALAAACVLAVGGLVVRAWRARNRDAGGRVDGAVPAFALGLAVALYLAYNVTFVQHQGRYLFPAIAPLAVFACVGWRELAWAAADVSGGRLRRADAARLVLYGFAAALAALAWLSLFRYVVPGLS